MRNHSSTIWLASFSVAWWNMSRPIALPVGGSSPPGPFIAAVLVPLVCHTAARVRPLTNTSLAVALASGNAARKFQASSTIASPPRRSGIAASSGQWLTASLAYSARNLALSLAFQASQPAR
jgi:hypothetical protein